MIPVIWEGDHNSSPGYGLRGQMYGAQYLPSTLVGGDHGFVGGGAGVYSQFSNFYNQLNTYQSPISIEDLEFSLSGTEIGISANVVLEQALEEGQYKIIYLITNRYDDNYFATVIRHYDQVFSLTNAGDSQVFSHSFPFDDSFDITNLKGVMFIQKMTGGTCGTSQYPLNARQIIQASQAEFVGTMALFGSNITSGPAALKVEFSNHSLPVGDDGATYAWDFDNDGTIDSTEKNPEYLYETPGTYTVALTVTADGETDTKIATDYITVENTNNISGNISGVWKAVNNPYVVTGNVIISENNSLIIEPGVNLTFENSAEINCNGLLNIGSLNSEPVNISGDWRGIKLNYSDRDNSIINANISNCSGNAVHVDQSRVLIKSSVFHNNGFGHALSVIYALSSKVALSSNKFINNNGTSAGVLTLRGSQGMIKNNIFANNSGTLGGALIVKSDSQAEFINNTLINNEYSSEYGADVYLFGSVMNAMNNIFYSINEEYLSINNINGQLSATYNCFPTSYEGVGNISENPSFVNVTNDIGHEVDAFFIDPRLSDGSPCIDAGNPSEDYNDNADGSSPAYPAMGTLQNDMGAFGGSFEFESWVDNDDEVSEVVNSDMIKIYPNPFNPKTMISFNLEQKSDVKISIFDLKGRVVKSFNLTNLEKGSRSIEWTGVNNNNEFVPSGIYFAKVATSNKILFGKMVLLK